MSRLFVIMLLAVTAVVGKPAKAQENEITAPPCLRIDETPLLSFIGEWDVQWKYRLEPGRYQDSFARSEIELELNQCALVEYFHGSVRGVPYLVRTTFVPMNDGSFSRSRLDTEHSMFSLSEGIVRNDSLIFESSRQFGERVMRTRHIYSPVDSGGFEVRFFMSRSMGDPWALVESAVYLRRSD